MQSPSWCFCRIICCATCCVAWRTCIRSSRTRISKSWSQRDENSHMHAQNWLRRFHAISQNSTDFVPNVPNVGQTRHKQNRCFPSRRILCYVLEILCQISKRGVQSPVVPSHAVAHLQDDVILYNRCKSLDLSRRNSMTRNHNHFF